MEIFKKHLPFLILFILFLVVGLSIYNDYGVSWDEPACHSEIGIVNYKYILDNNYEILKNNDAKYHGPAFELILLPLERFLGLTDFYHIFLMRHLVTFLLFALSIVFFYLFCLQRFQSIWLAILGAIMLICSPRIFAESFYNNKDLAFLSMVVISMFTTITFLERKSYRNAILHAFVCGFVIDIRIMGIIIPFFSFMILFFQFIKMHSERTKIIKVALLFVIVLTCTIILFWPILWRNPIENFINAFIESSKYPWIGNVNYLGKSISASELPWHYVPVWLGVTTPLLFIVLFLFGLIYLFDKIFKKIPLVTAEWLSNYLFFLPIVSVIILKSVLYDGWRHLYYIYPSFIFISLTGFYYIFQRAKNNISKNIMVAAITLYCFYIIFSMIQLHPYENLYFNRLAGKTLEEASKKFMADYWGLSYKEGIHYILESDTSKNIHLLASEIEPLENNIKFLPPAESKRFKLVPVGDSADYYLTSYRVKEFECTNCPNSYDIVRDKGIILSVIKTYPIKKIMANGNYLISSFANYSDSASGDWSKTTKVLDPVNYNNWVESIDTSTIFGSTLFYHPDIKKWNSESKRIIMFADIKVKSDKPYKGSIVFEADSGNGSSYSWNNYDFNSKQTGTWNNHSVRALIGNLRNSNDIIKVYFCNTNREKLLLDDIRINFYSLPDSTLPSFLSAYR